MRTTIRAFFTRASPLLPLLACIAMLAACGGGGGAVAVVGFQAGDTLPAYVHTIPRGSRADVRAKGQYAGGQWTVEICRLLDTGNADDARFTVGQDIHFSIAVTDNSGGTHNGANLVDLLWSGTPGSASVVVGDLQALGQSAPAIDGDASDGAWGAAPVSTLGLGPQSGNNGITSATVQAAYLDEFLYFRVTWDDATQNSFRRQWTFDGTNWARNSENEDRLFLMFEISNALGTAVAGSMSGTTTPFSQLGCSISCHGDGVMRLDSGRVDTWHWKASRTDPAGYLDDKFMIAADPGGDGRKSDQGLQAYFDNENTGGTEPGWRSVQGFSANPDALFWMPDDHDFAEPRSGNTGFASGDFLPGYVQRFPHDSRADVATRGQYDNGVWTVEFARALDTGNAWQWGSPTRFRDDARWQNGDTVAGYVTVPPIGSFGDVEAMGRWDAGTWTVEICRDLVTGNPDDTQFDPANDGIIPMFSIGITDNSGGAHNGNPLITLLWNGPFSDSPPWVKAEHLNAVGGHPPPVIDGLGNDLVWQDISPAGTGLTTVSLTGQSPVGVSNGIDPVRVQAVRSDTKVYFKFEWTDLTRHEFREQWTFDGTNWSQNSENEDRLFVMWDIDGAEGTGTPGSPGSGVPFNVGGCTIACHGDGLMHTSLNTVDIWHWKATRNNGSGWLDDKYADPVDRHADDGAGLASRNRNSASSAPNYQAFADPGADAVHLHFAGRSNPDDAAFVVGFRMPFALGLTDSSGGSHDGAPILHLVWGGTSTPTELAALDILAAGVSPPTIDGIGVEGVWSTATPADVSISPQSGTPAGISTAELRAAFDRDNIYVRVVWTDPSGTRDILKNRRVFDGSAWSTSGARDEDRCYFLWLMTEALGTATAGQEDGATTPFRHEGCAMACHGDGVMRTDDGLLDTWHWKAARTNGLGFTDDKYFTSAASGVSGRKGDFGRSSHSDNGTAADPASRALSGPGANMNYLVAPLASGAHRALSLTPAANVAPQANAGTDQTVQGGATVNLDGGASFDPNPGDTLFYAWVQTGGTNTVPLSGADTATPSFPAPTTVDVLTFRLTVSDGTLQDTDTVQVTVQVTPPAISYANDIHPIWTSRGCTACHGNSGGLTLSGTSAQSYDEVVNEGSRVDTGTPANSLILTKPLAAGAGGVSHSGGDYFPDTSDPDYVKILEWITDGAPAN